MGQTELLKYTIEEFSRLQDWMLLSGKDSEVYNSMYKRYIELKVILASMAVNLTELDRIKD